MMWHSTLHVDDEDITVASIRRRNTIQSGPVCSMTSSGRPSSCKLNAITFSARDLQQNTGSLIKSTRRDKGKATNIQCRCDVHVHANATRLWSMGYKVFHGQIRRGPGVAGIPARFLDVPNHRLALLRVPHAMLSSSSISAGPLAMYSGPANLACGSCMGSDTTYEPEEPWVENDGRGTSTEERRLMAERPSIDDLLDLLEFLNRLKAGIVDEISLQA